MAETKKGFIQRTIDRIKGDDAKGIASYNHKRAKNSFSQQISALEGKKLSAEDDLEAANMNLEAAIYPTEKIQDQQRYLQDVVNAKEEVSRAQDELDQINESLKFFSETLADF